MRRNWLKLFGQFLNKIVPKQYESPFRLQLIASISIGFGLFCVLIFNNLFSDLGNIGAYLCFPYLGTCFLVFLSPSSKTSQPLPIIFSYTTNAILAIVSLNFLSNSELAVSIALILSVGLMWVSKLVHLPALLIIPITVYFQLHSYSYIFTPFFSDALIIVFLGILLNPLMNKKYPFKENR